MEAQMLKAPTIAATAICLAFATAVLAQTGAGSDKSQTSAMQKCEGMKGAALEKCKQEAAPGRSGDSASRAGGATPGRSDESTSRSGTPPGSPAKKY